MANNIKKVYEAFRNDFEDNPDYIIDFYSKNSLFFNDISSFQNKAEIRLFIKISWQYINAIYQKDRFNEAVDFAEENLKLIDSELIRLNTEELKDAWYYGIWHIKGMAAFSLRNYKTSKSVYKYLATIDPKNDKFKNWLKYSTHGQRL